MRPLSLELLRNMALRYDHGLGCPGYYDSILGPGEHKEREALVTGVMDRMARYVMSMFYGSTLPHTPFKGLLDGMVSICPAELHPTPTTMTQIYEEIRDYLNGVTSCKDVTGDADPSEDIMNLGQGSHAPININPPTQEPMSFHKQALGIVNPPVDEFPWNPPVNSAEPLPPVPKPSTNSALRDWATRASVELRNGVENANELREQLLLLFDDKPQTRVVQFMLETLQGDIDNAQRLLDELPHITTFGN